MNGVSNLRGPLLVLVPVLLGSRKGSLILRRQACCMSRQYFMFFTPLRNIFRVSELYVCVLYRLFFYELECGANSEKKNTMKVQAIIFFLIFNLVNDG